MLASQEQNAALKLSVNQGNVKSTMFSGVMRQWGGQGNCYIQMCTQPIPAQQCCVTPAHLPGMLFTPAFCYTKLPLTSLALDALELCSKTTYDERIYIICYNVYGGYAVAENVIQAEVGRNVQYLAGVVPGTCTELHCVANALTV